MTLTTETSRTSITNPLARIEVTAAAESLYTISTFLTKSAWDIAVKWSQPVTHDQYSGLGIRPGENYEDVRLWDVLFMSRPAARRIFAHCQSGNHNHPSVPFVLTVVPDVLKPKAARKIKLHLHLADEGLIIHSSASLW